MPEILEFDLQRALCLWLDGNPDRNGVPRKTPALAPDVVYWHTPNGGTRSAVEGARLKMSGTKAGIHDLFFLRPTQFTEGVFGLLFGMEWKKPGGVLSPAQREMHPRLLRAGLAASCVVDNLVDAKAFCKLHALVVDTP